MGLLIWETTYGKMKPKWTPWTQKIYNTLSESRCIIKHVNRNWGLKENERSSKKLFKWNWNSIVEPKKVCFKWFLLLKKLPYSITGNVVEIFDVCKKPKNSRTYIISLLLCKKKNFLFLVDPKDWGNCNSINKKEILFGQSVNFGIVDNLF